MPHPFFDLNRQPQDKLSVPYREGIHASIPFHNGADTLHTNAMLRSVRNRQSFVEGDVRPARVCDLQKEFFSFLIALHIDGAGCLRRVKALAGMNRVLQGVGKQDTQVAVCDAKLCRYHALYLHADSRFARSACKGRKNQIHCLIFTVLLHFLRVDFLTNAGNIRLRLCPLSVLDIGGHILQVVPQVVPILACQHL